MLKKVLLVALPVFCLGLVAFFVSNRIIGVQQAECGKWEFIGDFPFEPGSQGGYANAIAAVSKDDVWVVGEGETRGRNVENYRFLRERDGSGPFQWPLIMHWDGKSLNIVSIDDLDFKTDAGLVDVTAVSADDVWAIGYYQASEQTYPYLYHAMILHWDGKTWSIVPSPQVSWETRGRYVRGDGLSAIKAVSQDDIWIVGSYEDDKGTTKTLIEHWDGSQWKIVPSPNREPSDNIRGDNYLLTLTVISADDIWAASFYSYTGRALDTILYLHWDGVEWSIVRDAKVIEDAYIPGAPVDGRYDDAGLESMLRISPNDVWAVGHQNEEHALILHWDGKSWTDVDAPTPTFYWDGEKIVRHPEIATPTSDSSSSIESSQRLRDVEAVAPNEMWTVGAYAPGSDIGEWITSPLVARYVACPGASIGSRPTSIR